MSNIKFRLAKPCDAKKLAECHWHVRDRYTRGIFLMLGKGFLKTYYKILLNEPWEIVVCAEREDGKIVGFSSSTQDAAKQAEAFKRHKLQLAFSAFWAIICKPSLIKEVWMRYKSISSDDGPRYMGKTGCRGDYWCWLKDEGDSLKSFEMENAKNKMLFLLGEKEIYGEIDKVNEGVVRYQKKVNKAEFLDEFTLPDGRVRLSYKIDLSKLK